MRLIITPEDSSRSEEDCPMCWCVCGIVKGWADRQLELGQVPPLCFPPGLPALLGLGLLAAAPVHSMFDPFRGKVTEREVKI